MPDLRILVVDDRDNWQEALSQILVRLGDDVQVDVATNYGDALENVKGNTYDLATVDLALLGDTADPSDSDQLGLELLRELRHSRRNRGCGLIVLTGYPTTERTRQALRDYAAYDFIEKDQFDDNRFIEIARAAILNARLHQARAKAEARYRLTLTFNQKCLVSSELTGPDRRAYYVADQSQQFEASDLARRADNLNLLITKEDPDLWRREARSIGEMLYEILAQERRVLGDLTTAQALAQRFSDLWLQFCGPAVTLGIPFELLQDQQDYLSLNYILSRRLVQPGTNLSHKPDSFHEFLIGLNSRHEKLRILIVGANSDGYIPAAEVEAQSLTKTIGRELEYLGLDHEVTLLSSSTATYSNVREALQDGHYHIFHYAGHGRFDDRLPEISSLILKNGSLKTSDLNLLLRGTDLRLAFLSSCLGARTADQVGRGDFHSMLESLVRADIPIVLSYRWTVADTPAMQFAKDFYQSLWYTFSPGEALLEARRNRALGKQGLDDDTWAAPVLLMQNQ